MRIYWIKAQAPRRVLALIKHLGVKAEFEEVDMMAGGFKAPDYVALNPNMKAPTLVDDGLVLWEASAIMAHLCIEADSDMWPARNPVEQVEVLRWLSWNDCHWSSSIAPFYFEHIVRATFGLGPPDSESLKAKVPDLVKYARVLDGHLEGRSYVAWADPWPADTQPAA
jgi:glutathione S-transferase